MFKVGDEGFVWRGRVHRRRKRRGGGSRDPAVRPPKLLVEHKPNTFVVTNVTNGSSLPRIKEGRFTFEFSTRWSKRSLKGVLCIYSFFLLKSTTLDFTLKLGLP